MQLKYQPDLDLKTRLKDLQPDASNAWRFFLVSYINFAIHLNKAEVDRKHFMERTRSSKVNFIIPFTVQHIGKLYEALSRKNPPDYLKYRLLQGVNRNKIWFRFYLDEIDEAYKLKKETNLRALVYLDYLKQNESKIRHFDFFLYRQTFKNHTISFENYAQAKLGSDFIRLGLYENRLIHFFVQLDNLYFKTQIFLERKIKEKEIQDIIQENFDFEQYASPIIFIDYPKQLAIYKRLLKNWLLMEVEKRKREFEWQEDTIYEPYKTVFKFAEQLLDPKEKDYLIKDSPEFFQYPKHIFAGFKAYKLFMEYLPSLSSQARFTFLYRYMREEEDPAFKILVEPAAFLDWYNQVRQNQLFDINQPLYKVKTNDRLQGYKMIKKIIQEIYPNV